MNRDFYVRQVAEALASVDREGALAEAAQQRLAELQELEELRERFAEQEREIARLRARTHEIQPAEMGKRAEMEARLAHYDNMRDWVRERIPRLGAGSSTFGFHLAIDLVAQRDAARQEAQDLHAQLQQALGRVAELEAAAATQTEAQA